MLYSDPHYYDPDGNKQRLFQGVKRVLFVPEAGHDAPGFLIAKGTATEEASVAHVNYWADKTSVNAASRHMRYMRPDLCMHPRPSTDEWIARRTITAATPIATLDANRNDEITAVRRVIAKALIKVPVGYREGSVDGLDYSETHKALKSVWPQLAAMGWRRANAGEGYYKPGCISLAFLYTATSAKSRDVYTLVRTQAEIYDHQISYSNYHALQFCAYMPLTRLFVYNYNMNGQPSSFSNGSDTVDGVTYGIRTGSGSAYPPYSRFRDNRRSIFGAADDIELADVDPLCMWSKLTGEYDSVDLAASNIGYAADTPKADPSLYGTALRIYGFDEAVESIRVRIASYTVAQADYDPNCWVVTYRRAPIMSFAINTQKMYENMIDFTTNVKPDPDAIAFAEGLQQMDGYAIHATYFTPQPVSQNVLYRTKIYNDIKKAGKLGELDRVLGTDEDGSNITLNTMNKKVNKVISKYLKIGVFAVPVKNNEIDIPRGPIGDLVIVSESLRASDVGHIPTLGSFTPCLVPPGATTTDPATWVAMTWAEAEEKIDDGYIPSEYRAVTDVNGAVTGYSVQSLSIETRGALNASGYMTEEIDASAVDPAYNLLPEEDLHSLSPYEHMDTIYPLPITSAEGLTNSARTFAFVGTEGYDDIVQVAARAIYA
jgi:hypothetical protein